MKRLLIVCTLALSLGGCGTLQDAFTYATTPVTVTPTMVYQIENGLKVATAGLVSYRRLCIQKVIDPVTRNCRSTILKIQPYTMAARTAIVELRAAVAANDQVTALRAFDTLRTLIANIQAQRQVAGGI